MVVPCSVLVFDSEANYPALTSDSKIDVQAGTFASEGPCISLVSTDHSSRFNITGGTFSSDPTGYVADGYAATEVAGEWTVAVASQTSEEAVPAAKGILPIEISGTWMPVKFTRPDDQSNIDYYKLNFYNSTNKAETSTLKTKELSAGKGTDTYFHSHLYDLNPAYSYDKMEIISLPLGQYSQGVWTGEINISREAIEVVKAEILTGRENLIRYTFDNPVTGFFMFGEGENARYQHADGTTEITMSKDNLTIGSSLPTITGWDISYNENGEFILSGKIYDVDTSGVTVTQLIPELAIHGVDIQKQTIKIATEDGYNVLYCTLNNGEVKKCFSVYDAHLEHSWGYGGIYDLYRLCDAAAQENIFSDFTLKNYESVDSNTARKTTSAGFTIKVNKASDNIGFDWKYLGAVTEDDMPMGKIEITRTDDSTFDISKTYGVAVEYKYAKDGNPNDTHTSSTNYSFMPDGLNAEVSDDGKTVIIKLRDEENIINMDSATLRIVESYSVQDDENENLINMYCKSGTPKVKETNN